MITTSSILEPLIRDLQQDLHWRASEFARRILQPDGLDEGQCVAIKNETGSQACR